MSGDGQTAKRQKDEEEEYNERGLAKELRESGCGKRGKSRKGMEIGRLKGKEKGFK